MEERRQIGKNLTNEEFLEKAFSKFNGKYEYLDEYTDSRIKIRIKCPIHGIFTRTPNRHLLSFGCSKCVKLSQTFSKETFIQKSTERHGHKYEYLFDTYTSLSHIYEFKCNLHDFIFLQNGQKHLQGEGCEKCKRSGRKDINWLQSLAKNNFGECLSTVYSGSNNKVKYNWKCELGHVWTSTAGNISKGKWCPTCKESKGERRISKYLQSVGLVINTDFFREHKFDKCIYKKRLPFDFYIPKLNMCIEYDGIQHFKKATGSWGKHVDLQQLQYRDSIKTKFCIDNSIKLLRISYKDFDKIESILQAELQ